MEIINYIYKKLININFKSIFFILILIIFSFSFRIYKVDTAPSGMLVDEASFGYNAFSILKTKKDEHGIVNPIIFKAFGDEKLPIYAYSIVPFIKIFGLSNLAVRLPSVLTGTFLSVFIFLLLLELGFTKYLSFLGALIASASPWSIIISRFGYESNIGLLFFTIGLYFFLINIRKNKYFNLILSGIFFGLTWYSYTAFRMITPIIVVSLIFIYLRKNKKIITIKGIIFFTSFSFIIIPLILMSFSGKGTARLKQAGLNTNLAIVLNINENRNFCGFVLPKIICYTNSNKIVSYTETYFSRFTNVYSLDYLFLKGDGNLKSINVDNYGLLPVILIPFYLSGLIYLFNKLTQKKITKNETLVLIALLITPLPSIIVGNPQQIRLSALLPFLIIVILYGIIQIETYIKKNVNKKIYYFLIILSLFISTFFFMINFLAIHIHKYESAYGTYIPKLMKYLNQENNKQIYIRSITEGIEYYAFFNKIDPIFYQNKVIREKPDSIGFSHATDLGNIHITTKDIYEIYCQSKKDNINAFYVTNENLEKTLGKSEKIIYSENGVDALAISI